MDSTPPLPKQNPPEWWNVYKGLTDAEIDQLDRAIQRSGYKPAILQLEQTCECAPAQWEGRTTDDRPIYIRGRHQILSARIGPTHGSIIDTVQGEEVIRIQRADAEVLSTLDMVCQLCNVIDFSKLVKHR